jgi:hypothetical protein
MSERLDAHLATAVVGLDTLWGGDVLNPSGTGRFIADSWFSDRPLPRAYVHDAADVLRRTGGVGAPRPDMNAVEDYLDAVDVSGAIAVVAEEARHVTEIRAAYLLGLARCLQVMWELALEVIGKGEPVPYSRCTRATMDADPSPSRPTAHRAAVAALLDEAGYRVDTAAQLVAAVDAWRSDHRIAHASLPAVAAAMVDRYDGLVERNVLRHLPEELAHVPRANVTFLPIPQAWFSGSMNYIGRERDAQNRPLYEATYEINSELQISGPELEQLVAHEVVPGHVTTFAWLQDLYVRREVHFEASILTMNTRGAALFEGIANNAVLIAHGVREVGELDPALRLGVLLALLQDEAKNQASWLTWAEGAPQEHVEHELRATYLVSPERAARLSGAWARHPLLGRMYLPLYRFGTEKVAELRRHLPPHVILPALYGCRGLLDVVTIDRVVPAGVTA